MYNYIISKNNIPIKRYKLINIDKDEKWFYKGVSYYLYWTIGYHSEIMNTISNVYQSNFNEKYGNHIIEKYIIWQNLNTNFKRKILRLIKLNLYMVFPICLILKE